MTFLQAARQLNLVVRRLWRRFRLASQRITIAKLAGVSGEIALQRFGTWSSARNAANPNLWSPEQWPAPMRNEADDFAERLRANGLALPVCHFVEWASLWSMGDLFSRWLTPPNCAEPLAVHGDRFEIFVYALPDGGRLAEYLSAAGPQQFTETDWFIARLLEAVTAWDKMVANATLVVMRSVVSGSALDEEVTACLRTWLHRGSRERGRR